MFAYNIAHRHIENYSANLLVSHRIEDRGSRVPGGQFFPALQHLDVFGVADAVVKGIDEFLILLEQLGHIDLVRHIVVLKVVCGIVDIVFGLLGQP